jgi:hypothetical protein
MNQVIRTVPITGNKAICILAISVLHIIPGCTDTGEPGSSSSANSEPERIEFSLTSPSGTCLGKIWTGDYLIDHRDTAGDIHKLSGYTGIDGNLLIALTSVTDLAGLECLESVAGNLVILSNVGLSGLEGLDTLRVVGKRVIIFFNGPSLTNLRGLVNLHVVGDSVLGDTLGHPPWWWNRGNLSIVLNSGLTSLRGMEGLDELGGNLIVAFNRNLPTCEAERLRDRLGDLGWSRSHWIFRNDDAASCPTDSCIDYVCATPPMTFCNQGGALVKYARMGTCLLDSTGRPECHYEQFVVYCTNGCNPSTGSCQACNPSITTCETTRH